MTMTWIEHLTGSFEDKKRWRAYKARKQQLPSSYRTAIDGIERYLTYAGAVSKGDVLVQMFEDLADLVERAAADATPIRELVGDNPVEFAEEFLDNYSDGQWISTERTRLNESIDRAVADES
jgi:DNA-binding ferritin-like protein (Dps family)